MRTRQRSHAQYGACLCEILCVWSTTGPPGELLADGHHGPFSKLIDRTGPAVSAHLRSVAQGNEAIDFATLHEEQTD